MEPFEQEWQDWHGRDKLLAACGDADLARLVYRVAGPESLNFLDQRPAVLNGRSPRQLLATRKGRQTLRKALMTFPYL